MLLISLMFSSEAQARGLTPGKQRAYGLAPKPGEFQDLLTSPGNANLDQANWVDQIEWPNSKNALTSGALGPCP